MGWLPRNHLRMRWPGKQSTRGECNRAGQFVLDTNDLVVSPSPVPFIRCLFFVLQPCPDLDAPRTSMNNGHPRGSHTLWEQICLLPRVSIEINKTAWIIFSSSINKVRISSRYRALVQQSLLSLLKGISSFTTKP